MNKILALLAFAVLLFLLYFITPYLADMVGRAIDQTLDQRRSEVERIIEAREAQEDEMSKNNFKFPVDIPNRARYTHIK